MAKENSFDVVSQLDLQEVDNAVNQANKEISTRYDFKNTNTRAEFDRQSERIVVRSDDDFHLRSAMDVLQTKLVRRDVDLKALRYGKAEPSSGGTVRQEIELVTGIDQDTARAINKTIKDQKLKVRVQIEGDKLRVFSKSRDELQEIINFLRSADFGVPLQFVNYRS